MFDIGFSELMVIAVVALIVIGPERLPRVARTAGALLGRLQRYVNDVKADVEREIQIEELKKLQQDVLQQAQNVERSVNERMRAFEQELNDSLLRGPGELSAEKIAQLAGGEAAASAVTAAPSVTPAATPAATTEPSEPAPPPHPAAGSRST